MKTKLLKVTISGSFVAGDKEIESFTAVTGLMPALNTEVPQNGVDVISKAEQMINKRYARIWIGQAVDDAGKPIYKRVGRVREVFVDSIEDEDDKQLSYVGMSIMDMNFEELQDLAAAKDLIGVPFHKTGSLTQARRVAFSEYAIHVLGLDKDKYDWRQNGFNPSRFAPIIADDKIMERGGEVQDVEESIDRDMLREEIKRVPGAKSTAESPLTLDQLKAVAKAKGIEFNDRIGFDALYKRVYPGKAA